MFKIFKQFKLKEWLMVALAIVFIIIQVWFDLKLPDFMAEITKLTQTPNSEMSDIWLNGFYMMACAFGSLIAAIIIVFLASKIGARISQRIRSLLFNKVQSFSMAEINQFSTSSLITRSTNDITQIQLFIVMGLQILVKAPITAIWALTKISNKGFEFTLITGIAVSILLVTVTTLMVLVIPKFKLMQTLTDNLTRVTRENLVGLRVVRAYNAEDYQEDRFEKANEDLTSTQLFTNRAMAIMMPVMMSILSGISLAIYWVGAYLIDAAQMMDKLTIFSNMVVFTQYAMLVIMSFMMLVMIFILWPRASVSAKRINEVLETKESIVDGDKVEGLANMAGDIEFKSVYFQYPDAAEPVLEDISFKAKKGETVAFIGSTGSGKSTLVNLIPRFFNATKGEILVNGINVKEYKLEALNSKIGYVSQKAVIFKGDIKSNVAFGKKQDETIDIKRLENAVEIAQAKDFIEELEDKYDSNVSQEGANLSGGQKQRIAIARAIYHNPEIYIFDDSFSALDYKTDRKLRNELKKETANATKLIVAQRIGTIIDADQIIVLDEGKIVGKGTHKELLKTCKVYKEIALSQLSEKELLV